jgi:hypothetical protein
LSATTSPQLRFVTSAPVFEKRLRISQERGAGRRVRVEPARLARSDSPLASAREPERRLLPKDPRRGRLTVFRSIG